MKKIPALALGALALLPQPLLACPVCFGNDNKDVVNAYIWGGAILLAFTMLILCALCYAVYRIEQNRVKSGWDVDSA